MANMSYCRFRNTLSDLRDCEDHMGTRVDDKHEDRARVELIKLCRRIAADFPDESED